MVAEVNRSELGRRNGGNVLSAQASERALLINLLARLRTLDADVYVGHNISAFDLDVLLHRLQFHKVTHPYIKRDSDACEHIDLHTYLVAEMKLSSRIQCAQVRMYI